MLDTAFIGGEESLCILFQPRTEVTAKGDAGVCRAGLGSSPCVPCLSLGRFFPHFVAQQIPRNSRGAPIQWGWATTTENPRLGLLKCSVWGGHCWLQRSSMRPVQSTWEKCSPSTCETLHQHMPSHIFGLRFAIPPSKSLYVLSKHFVKIKRDPRASRVSYVPTAGCPQERKGTAWEGCAQDAGL